jgi:hypothetical protein
MKNRITKAALLIAMLGATFGVAAARDWDGDGDDYRYDNGYSNQGYGYGGYGYGGYGNGGYGNGGYGYGNFRMLSHVARDYGFRDGAQVAREDGWRGKPFNPNPRGRFDDADHGYSRRFGDKRQYRQIYSEAYRRGYQSAFRGDGNGYDREGYYR